MKATIRGLRGTDAIRKSRNISLIFHEFTRQLRELGSFQSADASRCKFRSAPHLVRTASSMSLSAIAASCTWFLSSRYHHFLGRIDEVEREIESADRRFCHDRLRAMGWRRPSLAVASRQSSQMPALCRSICCRIGNLRRQRRGSKPVRTIVDLVGEFGADRLVIRGTGHSPLYERMIGARTGRIVQLAGCPVLA